MVQIEEDAHHVRCIISPNHSISWRQLRVCILVLALVSLTIAGFWALQGAWVIVPFAGLEVAVVYVFLRKVSARVHAAEVLEFDAERISLVWDRAGRRVIWLKIVIMPRWSVGTLITTGHRHGLCSGPVGTIDRLPSIATNRIVRRC